MLVFATVDCFPPFVFLVGVPPPAVAVLRTLPFCALPGAAFRAILGGIVVQKCAGEVFLGSGVLESDQLGGLSPSNQRLANCRVCVEIVPCGNRVRVLKGI